MTDRRILQVFWAIVIGAITLLAYTEIGTATTHTRCVARGYPDYYVTWTLERYCIKRVNQTDIVHRLDSLEAHP